MKILITAAKQVGKVYYMVDSLESLYNILIQGQIKVSSKKEKSTNSSKPEYFVSLTRDYKALYKQNPDRWHCGIILDGNKLSEIYSIYPFHFSGYNLENTSEDARCGKFVIKAITAWEDGTYDIQFAGWKSIFPISKAAYDDLANCILNFDKDILNKCKFQRCIGKSKSSVKKCKFLERLLFNNPAGGPPGILKKVNQSTFSEILSLTNQHEERISGPKDIKNLQSRFKTLDSDLETIYPYIHINNAITGLVFNAEDFNKGSILQIEHNNEVANSCKELLKLKYRLNGYIVETIKN